MQQAPCLLRDIWQFDHHHFIIEWSDGKKSKYRLSELQKKCPCAGCQEASFFIEEDVRAFRVVSVGRYAIRIDFEKGCSFGIYDFDLLRSMGEEVK